MIFNAVFLKVWLFFILRDNTWRVYVCVCFLDPVSEAVVHQSRRRSAGLQNPAHAVGRRHRLLPWKSECRGNEDNYFHY